MTSVNESAIPIKPTGVRPRLESIDILRGLIMILMALDHVRDFFSHDAILFGPLDLAKTHGALFLTRWITHFCAPGFCFLAGTGAFLSLGRGKTCRDLAAFLVSRGLWLIFLELTFLQCLGWNFDFSYREVELKVIWALGCSMVALAALIYLPTWGIATVAIVMIAGHNLLDPIRPEIFGSFAWLWTILHAGGLLHSFDGHKIFVGYPLVPWIGVMAAGYTFGAWFRLERAARKRCFLWLGVGLTMAFIVLRALNWYGDPHQWHPQKSLLFTVFDFIRCQKYPPSLLYLLMTLGPAIIALALLDREPIRLFRPLIVFGRVPLFFYLLHVPLVHGLAVAFSYVKYGRADWLFGMGSTPPGDYGFGLAGVYAVWLFVILTLYYPCRWFAELKQRRRDAWLSYF